MAEYRTCTVCGAHLDHGAMCDCERDRHNRVRAGTGRMEKKNKKIIRAEVYINMGETERRLTAGGQQVRLSEEGADLLARLFAPHILSREAAR